MLRELPPWSPNAKWAEYWPAKPFNQLSCMARARCITASGITSGIPWWRWWAGLSQLPQLNANRTIPTAPPRTHAIHRRLSNEVREQLLADYQTGISAKQLGHRYQLSRSSIRVLLRESGLPQRYQAMTEAEADQAVKLYNAGSTIAEVAAALGRPHSTIQTALTRRGVAMRRRHDYA